MAFLFMYGFVYTKKAAHNRDTRTVVLSVILRKTLLKKGSSSNSFPKTFSIKFSPDRALPVILPGFTFFVKRPVWAKFSYKVFGKGARGKNLSSERFVPDNYA